MQDSAGGSGNVFDVVVAGLGAMGSATLDQLARRGARVLGIDPFGIAHGEGSSGGETRLIRRAYFEHPDYVPLLSRAYDNWRILEAEVGSTLLLQTGTVYLGAADSELIAGSRRSAERYGIPLENLSATELAELFPPFGCPDGYVAAFEPEAGLLLCQRAIRAQAESAVRHGARLASGERLLSWQPRGDGVEVVTDQRRYVASTLVLAVGAWSAGLCGLDLGLTVTRQVQYWVQPTGYASFELGRFPCWAIQRPDAPGLFYGFPALPDALSAQYGAKLAHHAPGEPVDPDQPRAPASVAELQALMRAVTPFLPGLDGPTTGSRACMYTMSRDGHFIIDRHPQHQQVILACGFSGHGFKFASVLGEALADLALEGASELPIGFLGLR